MAPAVVRVGPLEYEMDAVDDAALAPAEARYALERLWAVASGGVAYGGDARIRIRPVSATAYRNRDAAISSFALDGLLPGQATVGLDCEALPAFAEQPARPLDQESDTRVVFNVDIAAFAFFMLARVEEVGAGGRDGRDRFPASASAAERLGFLDRPVVDQWALVLRAWVEFLDPTWRARASMFRVLLSHDIDAIQRYPRWRDIATAAGASLLRRRNPRAALRRCVEGWRARRDWRADPFYKGLRRLMEAAERHGLTAAFYFKTSAAGPYDTGYDLAHAPGPDILREVAARGHEIGFHPGYDTYCNRDLLEREKRRLETLLPEPVAGGRQHNLRFRAPDTWQDWEAVGLRYDSTLGYAERAGFRCGTCHPYPVFDVASGRQLALIEVPLIVMDTTLFFHRYEKLPPQAAIERIRALAARCSEVGGVFTLLWHNTSFEGAYETWGNIYESVIENLAQARPGRWIAAQS